MFTHHIFYDDCYNLRSEKYVCKFWNRATGFGIRGCLFDCLGNKAGEVAQNMNCVILRNFDE